MDTPVLSATHLRLSFFCPGFRLCKYCAAASSLNWLAATRLAFRSFAAIFLPAFFTSLNSDPLKVFISFSTSLVVKFFDNGRGMKREGGDGWVVSGVTGEEEGLSKLKRCRNAADTKHTGINKVRQEHGGGKQRGGGEKKGDTHLFIVDFCSHGRHLCGSGT